MSKLIFKELGQGQLQKSAEIVGEAFNEIAEQFGFSRQSDLSGLLANLDENAAAGAVLLGAFSGDDQIGFVKLDEKDQEIFEIMQLSVLPEHQKKGYGQQILEKAFEVIKGKSGVAAVCAIMNDNEPLKGWLAKNGFFEEASGRFEGMPCTVCLLQKDLPA